MNQIVFPLYKLRSYTELNTNPLGLVKVTTIHGTYILDDTSINKPFEERRAELYSRYDKKEIYKLKEQVLYFRQLIKYKTGSVFIDHNGYIFKYIKSSKLYEITCHEIVNKSQHDNWTIIKLNGVEIPFLVGKTLTYNTTHASIMHTKWGPMLYDLTSKYHEPYRRKV